MSRHCSLATFLHCAFTRQLKMLFEAVGGGGRCFFSFPARSVVKSVDSDARHFCAPYMRVYRQLCKLLGMGLLSCFLSKHKLLFDGPPRAHGFRKTFQFLPHGIQFSATSELPSPAWILWPTSVSLVLPPANSKGQTRQAWLVGFGFTSYQIPVFGTGISAPLLTPGALHR